MSSMVFLGVACPVSGPLTWSWKYGVKDPSHVDRVALAEGQPHASGEQCNRTRSRFRLSDGGIALAFIRPFQQDASILHIYSQMSVGRRHDLSMHNLVVPASQGELKGKVS